MLHQMSRRNPSDTILELGEPVQHEPDLSERQAMLRPARSTQGSPASLSWGLPADLGVSMVQKEGVPMDRDHEIEAALIVYADAPQAIEHRLAGLQGGGDASIVERITASLRDGFPSQLRPWPYGKLPTGQAIQEFLADGQLDGLTGRDGMLRPGAWEQIAGVLNRGAMGQPRQAPG
jgi:hypothetical protein